MDKLTSLKIVVENVSIAQNMFNVRFKVTTKYEDDDSLVNDFYACLFLSELSSITDKLKIIDKAWESVEQKVLDWLETGYVINQVKTLIGNEYIPKTKTFFALFKRFFM